MKLKVTRDSLQIIPENEQDKAFIDDTLGLKNANDEVSLIRVPCNGLQYSIAYLEAKNNNQKAKHILEGEQNWKESQRLKS